MDIVSKRNFQALAEGLKEQRNSNSDRDSRFKILEEKVSFMEQKLNKIEKDLTIALAILRGTGPTVKGG